MVNVYRVTEGENTLEQVKSLMNLTTAVSDLRFDQSGQMLALCSKWKKNAVRIIHTGPGGSFTAF